MYHDVRREWSKKRGAIVNAIVTCTSIFVCHLVVPISHVGPVNVSGQSHVGWSEPFSTQIPPFQQGLLVTHNSSEICSYILYGACSNWEFGFYIGSASWNQAMTSGFANLFHKWDQ